eukprot:SAG11_NODE_225_length_12064_cov_7.850815_13_plen_42_part_00
MLGSQYLSLEPRVLGGHIGGVSGANGAAEVEAFHGHGLGDK